MCLSRIQSEKSPPDVESLWRRFKIEKDDGAREKLAEHYLQLVKYVVDRIAIGLPPHIDKEDLVSDGIIGLLDAVDRFDLARNIKFETYAITRIRGAVFDALRELDWVPRSVRQKAREVEQAYTKIEMRHGRAANDNEVAQELGISIEEFEKVISRVSGVSIQSLEEAWGGDEGDKPLSLIDMIEDGCAHDPAEILDHEELLNLMAQAVDELPEKERLVVALYYKEKLTLKEIGAVLDVTESRVSQMHSKAIIKLRGTLRKLIGVTG